MEFRTIRQTSHIEGSNRNPGIGEHDKALVWDDNLKKVKYVLINGLSANSKTVDGYVVKGDDSPAANYIWKLDGTKNPAWRLEEYLASIDKVGNSAIFTMNSGGTKEIALGALAWEDTVPSSVLSVFGRSGAVLAMSGDYTAAQVTNAFDKLNDTLDDIVEGDTNKHFTATYKAEVDANTLARHTHANKAILDLIVDAGGGVIPTAAQIFEWDTWTSEDAENVRDTVADFIQDNTGITWTHDDDANTLTPEIHLDDFTTDDLPEGLINKYCTHIAETIVLNASSDVATRLVGLVEGVNYPTGWVLSVDSGVNLVIAHNLAKEVAFLNVFELDGFMWRIAKPFSDGFSGFLCDGNSVIIEGLDTLAVPIKIELMFNKQVI